MQNCGRCAERLKIIEYIQPYDAVCFKERAFRTVVKLCYQHNCLAVIVRSRNCSGEERIFAGNDFFHIVRRKARDKRVHLFVALVERACPEVRAVAVGDFDIYLLLVRNIRNDRIEVFGLLRPRILYLLCGRSRFLYLHIFVVARKQHYLKKVQKNYNY